MMMENGDKPGGGDFHAELCRFCRLCKGLGMFLGGLEEYVGVICVSFLGSLWCVFNLCCILV